MILEITFERDDDVCKKQCLYIGLTCIILKIAFQRAATVCVK